jgi:nicotinate-nucleotide adenylyltransferase
MIKVGLLGGAFNPPTLGHVQIAEYVLENTDLNEVWLVPCYKHLYGKELESPKHRLNMCRIAVADAPHVHAFDYEIRHEMEGSTFDFFEKLLNDEQLDADVSMIIGQDNANSLENFHKSEELRELVKFIVVGRAGVEADEGVGWYKKGHHTYLPEGTGKPCSSTMVREHLEKKGYEYCEHLNGEVLKYIKKNRLYPNSDLLKKIKKEKEKAERAANKMFIKTFIKELLK